MIINNAVFHLGSAFQFLGLISVGFCLISGLSVGDYSKVDLYLFLGGAGVFYFGHFLKKYTGR